MAFRNVDTKDPRAVAQEVREVYEGIFPDYDPDFVDRFFGWLDTWFTGRYKDYQAIDAPYHDYEHTLQGTLCLARLLYCRHKAGAQPELSRRNFELGVLAIMMHDTGYLKHADDVDGTGAKYTLTHVDRSAAFADQFLSEQGFTPDEVRAVKKMIYSTGVNTRVEEIPFANSIESLLGAAVATSDMLGQMAAGDYVDKISALYDEFAEAAAFNPDRPGFVHRFKSKEQLLSNTPGFWEQYAKPKLKNHCNSLYEFLNQPYPDGDNEYVSRIEANIEKVRRILSNN